MQTNEVPAPRKSILATGQVKPVGPTTASQARNRSRLSRPARPARQTLEWRRDRVSWVRSSFWLLPGCGRTAGWWLRRRCLAGGIALGIGSVRWWLTISSVVRFPRRTTTQVVVSGIGLPSDSPQASQLHDRAVSFTPSARAILSTVSKRGLAHTTEVRGIEHPA